MKSNFNQRIRSLDLSNLDEVDELEEELKLKEFKKKIKIKKEIKDEEFGEDKGI